MNHQESVDITTIAATIEKEALLESYLTVKALGQEGTNTVHKRYAEMSAVRGDFEAEDAILRVLEKSGLRITVFSEEHGKVVINSHSKSAVLTGVLDGIDGSGVYVKNRESGRYGTMFAIFNGDNPKYADYIAAGIMQHATAKMVIAARGQGARVLDVITKNEHRVRTKTDTIFTPEKTVAFVDNLSNDKNHPLYEYFTMNDSVFAKPLANLSIKSKATGAAAEYHAAIAMGEADIVGEGTRKGNLEIAVAYGLVKEAGGVMVTLDGQDMGSRLILEFSQHEHTPVLTAANHILAETFLNLVGNK